MLSLYKNFRNPTIPIDLQLKLFDAMVEKWGYENTKCT